MIAQDFPQQGFSLGFVAQIGKQPGILANGVLVTAEKPWQLIPKFGERLKGRRRLTRVAAAFLSGTLQKVLPNQAFQIALLFTLHQIALADFRQQAGKLAPVFQTHISVFQQLEYKRMVGRLLAQPHQGCQCLFQPVAR